MPEKAEGKMMATVSAKIIRADGTEEDLGIISVTDADAAKIAEAIRDVAPDQDEQAVVDVEARNAAESEANQAETKRQAEEDAARYNYQREE